MKPRFLSFLLLLPRPSPLPLSGLHRFLLSFDLLGKPAACLQELVAHTEGLIQSCSIISIDGFPQPSCKQPQTSKNIMRCIGRFANCFDHLFCLVLLVLAVLCPSRCCFSQLLQTWHWQLITTIFRHQGYEIIRESG